jgi:hypothetical protein
MNLNLTEEKRKALAERLCREIEASDNAKGSLPDRWKLNRGIYNVEDDVVTVNVIDDVKPYAMPLYRAKADRIADSVISTFTKVEPYVQVLTSDYNTENETNADRYEDALMCLAKYSNFKRTFKRAFVECMNTDLGIMKVFPKTDEEGSVIGIESKRIKPEAMVGYPTYVSSFEECTTIGERFFKAIREVEQLQKDKIYYPGVVVKTSAQELVDENQYSAKAEVDSSASLEDEYDLEPVKLYELITEEKIENEWVTVLCVVAYDTRELLSCQEYIYPLRWYCTMRIDDEDDSLWPSNSVAQRVQGLSLAYSDGLSTLFIGSFATAFPIITVNGTLGGTKNKKWQPGMILEMPQGVEAKVLSTGFNPGALPMSLQKIEEMADAVMGVSRIGTGQGLPSETRQAAIEGIMSSDQTAKEGYSDAVAPAVQKYFQLLDLYLVTHFHELLAQYGGKLRVQSPEEIPVDYKLEVTGQTSASNPNTLLQKLQMLMQMAAQPTSSLSPRKVEERISQTMDLPFDAKSLSKDEIDQLLAMIAYFDQNGMPGAQIAMQGLMMAAQQIEQEAMNDQGAGSNAVGGQESSVPPQSSPA